MTQPGTGAVVWCGRRVLSCGGLLQVWDLKACNTPLITLRTGRTAVINLSLGRSCASLARLLLLRCVLRWASCLAPLLPSPHDVGAARALR